ncbi:MAG TPA: PAS domain S-box protein [Armatimonadota bacterium]|jgi:PAS domain S-box-containing protein
MNERSKQSRDLKVLRDKVIGLGEGSTRKSYYPELQQRLVQLEESESRFRAIYDSVSDAIFVLSASTGAVLDVNQRVCDLFGYSREEVCRLGICGLSADGNSETHTCIVEFAQGAATSRPRLLEWHATSRSGCLLWLEVSVCRARVGGDDCALVTARDITDRKLAKEALKESEAQLRTLINAMPDIVCFKDGEGRWLEANEFDLNLFELQGVDYRGKKDSDLAENSEFFRDAFLACEKTDEAAWQIGAASRVDETIPTPDGDERVFDIVKVPTFHDDGRRKGLVVIGRDITERKRVEEERLATEAHKRRFYRDTIRSVTDGRVEICDASETEPYVAEAQVSLEINHPSEARSARLCAESVFGEDANRLGEFTIAVGEAISNALKHGSSGTVHAGRNEEEIWVVVEDRGPGIESVILPSAVLRRGFSTKPSLGMGFSIMLAAADRILLKTGYDGTTVVLIKRLHERDPEITLTDLWDMADEAMV